MSLPLRAGGGPEVGKVKDAPASAKPITQTWVSVALLIGGAIALAWAVFLAQFFGEPSAVGPVRAVLLTWSGMSLATFILAVPAAIMLLRRDRLGRSLGWFVSILMTATWVGAIAGIPALIGLGVSRRAAKL
jgi:hypothetical protein